MSVISWFMDDLYTNCFTLVTVLLSGIISWIISAAYFHRGNRNNLKDSVILPIVELLKRPYTKKNYMDLGIIIKGYSARYLYPKERKVLNELKKAYKAIASYHENSVNAGILYDYFEDELKKNNINWKHVPMYINDELVDYEPPEGWFSLPDDIEKILNRYELEFETEECENAITNLYKAYCKHYFSVQKISFFKEKKLKKVIAESEITKDWNQKFQNLNNAKDNFLSLKITKSIICED